MSEEAHPDSVLYHIWGSFYRDAHYKYNSVANNLLYPLPQG